MSNNEHGINAFSGPMGQKEPAYGTAENMKILGKIGVEPPPSANAAKKSQRRAQGKKGAKPTPVPPQPQVVPEQAPVAAYGAEMATFWQELAAQPGASPLIQQLAAQATSVS